MSASVELDFKHDSFDEEAKFDEKGGSEARRRLREEAERSTMILILGATGAGKSYFINTLKPGSCETSARLGSCTQKPAAVEAVFDGRRLLLIDTPGFNDTRSDLDRSDAVILEEIAKLVALQSALGFRMQGILYLHSINQPRMTGEPMRQLVLLQKICGEDNWNHVSLVTTQWPDEKMQQKFELGTRESDLRREYWRPMIRKGSAMNRFDGDQRSAESIVRSLMAKGSTNFALQREMIEHTTLAETTAGKFIIEARRKDENLVQGEEFERLPYQSQLQPDDMAELPESIRQRKSAEPKLQQNIQEAVEVKINQNLRKEAKRTGRFPRLADIISIIIGLGSLATNLAQVLA